MKFFKDDANAVEKGKIKLRSGFVLELSLSDHTISVKVKASMKDRCYSVAITVDGEGGILEASCDCSRVLGFAVIWQQLQSTQTRRVCQKLI